MKKRLPLIITAVFCLQLLQGQVTQINSNKSLQLTYQLTNNKAVYMSGTDKTLWVTDGTLGGTIQLSADIKFAKELGSTAFLNGKFIFAATTPATGTELFITDGTPAGTLLLSDINAGTASSNPGEGAMLNGILYFTADRLAEGRELWRTDGTPGGTAIVKDIVTGTGSSNYPNKFHLFSNGAYLLFMARTPASGVELWRSDGSNGGTVLLKDINTNAADSSGVESFFTLNSLVLFVANNFTNGFELWKTDGTPGGTVLVKDINPGITGSKASFYFGSIVFNNRAYFSADDGTNGEEIWGTNGTEAGTSLLKNIEPGAGSSVDFVVLAVITPAKFIFTSTNSTISRNQLWESDGTTAGTKLFKAFDGVDVPLTLPNFNSSPTGNQTLFQGNKFFFTASTAAQGNELWISDGVDGTPAHTQIVKDINPGSTDGIDASNGSYIYTSTTFFFPANNGTNGLELFKTDGTLAGTAMVADIVTIPAVGSDPTLSFSLVNGKVLFEANNGDDPINTDLYAVDGIFTPLPVSLVAFTVTLKSGDGMLSWVTLQELNSKNFTVQRSFDGQVFENIGTVTAMGNSATRRTYALVDAGIAGSGKSVVYYRLLATDIDGKSTLSPVITLKLNGGYKWTVKMINNPLQGNMKVLLSGITQNVQLSIVDMSGKKIYTTSRIAANGLVSIPVTNLPQGLYTLIAETNNERKTIRFVK